MSSKRKIQNLSVVLLAALLCATLLSCGANETEGAPQTTGPESESAATADSTVVESTKDEYSVFPDVKMNGRSFKIYMPGYIIERNYIVAESENGDVLNDAAYRRNVEIEEKFDIQITVEGHKGTNTYGEFSKLFMSGDNSVDAIITFPYDSGFTSLATKGMLYNWLDLKYVDLSKPSWNAGMNNSLIIGSKLFYACGETTIASQGHDVLLFNKKMADDNGLANPYKYVFDGTWTMDKLMEFTKGVYVDTNGNAERDNADTFGYVDDSWPYRYFYSCGGKVTDRDSDGKPVISVINDHTASIVQKTYDLLFSSPGSYSGYSKKNETDAAWQHFFDGKALIVPFDLGTYHLQLRSTEFDFGILPLPKLDEQQEQYYSVNAAGFMGIPANVKDPDNTGIIIQALAEGSYKYMRPAFFDVVLYHKCLRDEESRRVFEIIKTSRTSDFGYMFDTDPKMAYMLNEVVLKKESVDYVSYCEKITAPKQKAFDRIFADSTTT